MRKLMYSIVILAIALSGCKSKKSIDEITIGTFSMAIDYSPYYVAKHFKWFEDSDVLKGKKITFMQFNDRDAIAASLGKNELNVVFAAEPPIIITKAQGADVKIVDISCVLRQEILINNQLNVSSPSELKGYKIAVLAGTSSHYGLIEILKKYHVDNTDNNRFMAPDEARTAFERGDIDAWAVWPPFVEQQLVNGNGKILQGGDAVIQSVVAMPSIMLTDYPEISKEIISIVNKAKTWIEENPQEAISIVAKEIDLNVEIVELAWNKHLWSAKLDKRLIDDIQDKANFLAEQKMTRNNIVVNAKDLIFGYDEKYK